MGNYMVDDFYQKENGFDSFDEPSMKTMRDDSSSVVLLGKIDQYEVIRKLGGGGFGVVYLVRDSLSNVNYAIKTIHPLLKNNLEEIENIRQQFFFISRLTHSHIAPPILLHPVRSVELYDDETRRDLHVFSGDFIMILKYAPGVTLSKWTKQFPKQIVPVENAIDICKQVASALDYAHFESIIHRDIKPSNIMVETHGNNKAFIRVLDFGLAAEIRSSMSRVSSEQGDTSDTRPYMAPEQWQGKRQGPATDQYSLACMFYELVSGSVPFAGAFETGDVLVMLNSVSYGEVEPLPMLSEHQNNVLKKALSKNGEERFPNCSAFINSLENSVVNVSSFGQTVPNGDSAFRNICKRCNFENKPVSLFSENCGVKLEREDNAERDKLEKKNAKKQSRVNLKKQGNSNLPRKVFKIVYACVVLSVVAFAIFTFIDSKNKSNILETYNLGVSYTNGDNVAQNYEKAVKCFLEAANQGHAESQNMLARCYDEGKGVAQDQAEAVAWYRKAAEQGLAEAQYNLGACYYNGIGVEKDSTKAMEWFKKAAEQGSSFAQTSLGNFYYNGESGFQNYAEAVKWYNEAAKQDNAYAQVF